MVRVIGQDLAISPATVIVGCSNGMPKSPCNNAQSQLRYWRQIGSSSPYFFRMFAIAKSGSGCWVWSKGPPGTACMSPKISIVTTSMTRSSVRNRWTR